MTIDWKHSPFIVLGDMRDDLCSGSLVLAKKHLNVNNKIER